MGEVQINKIETGYAEVNGTRLYYEVAGAGVPIVLIHGALTDVRTWDDQFDVFAKSYRVIRYDARGFGKSAMPIEGEGYKPCEDLRALLDLLGIEKAHICGLSMGCSYAVDFVVTYPEMSLSLIAAGPVVGGYYPPSFGETMAAFSGMKPFIEKDDKKGALEYWRRTSIIKNAIRNPEVESRIKEMAYGHSFWTYIHEDPQEPLDPPASELLDKLDLPTLIITSEFDLRICRETTDFMEHRIPDSTKIDIVGAGHQLNMENPDEFNMAVMDFLKKIEWRRRSVHHCTFSASLSLLLRHFLRGFPHRKSSPWNWYSFWVLGQFFMEGGGEEELSSSQSPANYRECNWVSTNQTLYSSEGHSQK